MRGNMSYENITLTCQIFKFHYESNDAILALKQMFALYVLFYSYQKYVCDNSICISSDKIHALTLEIMISIIKDRW